MRSYAAPWLRNAIRLSSRRLQSPLFLVTALFLLCGQLGMTLAQAPSGKAPRKTRPAASQATGTNAAQAQNTVPSQNAAQIESPDVVPLLRQNLPQDPLRIAIQNGIKQGLQEAKTNPAATIATQPAAGNTAQFSSQNAAPNSASNVGSNTPSNNKAQNRPSSANPPSNGPPSVNREANPNQPAAATLVCQGTRPNGTAFTFPFEPDTSPAPTPGVACVPSGKTMPKGTAVMGTAPKASKVFAVVFVPPSTAEGANTSAAGSASERLVCQGTRPNGNNFTLLFDPNASPAPAAGDACIPSGQKMAKGTAVMSTAPKTGPALAVVVVPSTPTGEANKNGARPAAAPTGQIPPAINAGIQSLVSAKASLENAGNKWGGHKEPAIKLIDEALKACGQTATPDNTGTKPKPAGEMAAMEAALKQLTAAQNHFNSAANAWGGRRDQAKALISQALSELNAGIAFAKSHNAN